MDVAPTRRVYSSPSPRFGSTSINLVERNLSQLQKQAGGEEGAEGNPLIGSDTLGLRVISPSCDWPYAPPHERLKFGSFTHLPRISFDRPYLVLRNYKFGSVHSRPLLLLPNGHIQRITHKRCVFSAGTIVIQCSSSMHHRAFLWEFPRSVLPFCNLLATVSSSSWRAAREEGPYARSARVKSHCGLCVSKKVRRSRNQTRLFHC